METQKFNLDDVQDPRFVITVGGEDRSFNAFEMMDKVRDMRGEPGAPEFNGEMEKLRALFGFPPKGGTEKTISNYATLRLFAAFMSFVAGETERLGKLAGGPAETTPSLPASTTGTPA